MLCDTNWVWGGSVSSQTMLFTANVEKDLALQPAPAGCNPRSWVKQQKH